MSVPGQRTLKCLAWFRIRSHRDFRIAVRTAAILIGLSSACWMGILQEKGQFFASWLVMLPLILAAIAEFVAADLMADRYFPYSTERKLWQLENTLGINGIEKIADRLEDFIADMRGCDTSLVSGTVHVLVDLPSTNESRNRVGLLQLTDYVGPDGGRKGRITLINQGVIGRCARTGRMETADFADEEDYRFSMIREFGFTKLEAERHTVAGRSYLAYPLVDRSQELLGVAYFFTTEPQVFPRAAKHLDFEAFAKEISNYVDLAQLA